MTSSEIVLGALGDVHDPELDEPITKLGFVTSCEASPAGDVEVTLRLPTPQCAPNFAFLMAADARAAVRRVPGVREVTIRLEDHYTGEEINAALGRDEGFTGAFPGETADDDLASLRELFLRKALVARQSRLCERLLAAGSTPEEVTRLTVKDLPDARDSRRCIELRETLGLPYDEAAPAFVLPSGAALEASDVRQWLRTARLIRMSIEVNGGICRSLLRAHRGIEVNDPEEELEEVALT
jgi:metal-sulfur cluster biosynthetic enzyme